MKEKSRSKKDVKPKPVSHKHTTNNPKKPQHPKLSEYENKETSLAASSTDENEDEGLGDGNMGRSQKDILGNQKDILGK